MPFQLIPDFPGPPFGTSTCFTCRKPRYDGHGKIIDLGVRIDEITDLDGNTHSFGTPAMCEDCVRELVFLIGGLAPGDANSLRQELRESQGREQQLRRDIENIRSAVKAAV